MPNQEAASAWIFGNSSVRVGTQGLFCPYLKTFVPPFLPARLTAPGSPRMQSAKLNTDETFFMAGTEYFGATAQPRDHISEFCQLTPCGNHTITHFRHWLLPTTKHNLVTFNTSKISPNNWEKLRLLADKHLSRRFSYPRLIPGPRNVKSHGRQTNIDPVFIFTPEKD